jgi:hypothetical protein
MRACLALCCLLLAAPACHSSAPSPAAEPAPPRAAPMHPPIVEQLIARQLAQPKKNPPGSLWHYTYRGQSVYYVPPSCCDVESELHAGDGTVLCRPDGGMTGRGDGKCPDFFEVRTDEKRLWADPR